MGKKDKKKGKGAEKTAAKTEKKAIQKAKKELAAKGEEDIDKLIDEFQKRDDKVNAVSEERCSAPTPRSGLSLCICPDKEECLLFGGEFFNGSKTEMYNDLYFYNLKKDQWSIFVSNNKPPPRCSHQSVVLAQGGGQMWMFGGEFASPTRSNFHHYKDLWIYHLSERRWEQIKASNGPSSRSGHRMVSSQKNLVVFGGFHETLRDYKYFNDVHIFDLETYKWTKVEIQGKCPSPRSGCQMLPVTDGRVLVYGGYCREKVKKDVDKGISYNDMYLLQSDAKSSVPKWKWVAVKQTGFNPTPRSGFSVALAPGNRAFFFGGVVDVEDEDEVLKGVFYNDLYALEIDKSRWLPIVLHGKAETTEKKRRRKPKDNEEPSDECEMEDLEIEENSVEEIKTYEDSVFTVKVGVQNQPDTGPSTSLEISYSNKPFCPHTRMNAAMFVKHGTLYLYGGMYEEGDKQFTLSDFYSLDLHKLDEWKTIIPSNIENFEWCDSESSNSDDGSDGSEGDEGDHEEQDENKESSEKVLQSSELAMDTS